MLYITYIYNLPLIEVLMVCSIHGGWSFWGPGGLATLPSSPRIDHPDRRVFNGGPEGESHDHRAESRINGSRTLWYWIIWFYRDSIEILYFLWLTRTMILWDIELSYPIRMHMDANYVTYVCKCVCVSYTALHLAWHDIRHVCWFQVVIFLCYAVPCYATRWCDISHYMIG